MFWATLDAVSPLAARVALARVGSKEHRAFYRAFEKAGEHPRQALHVAQAVFTKKRREGRRGR